MYKYFVSYKWQDKNNDKGDANKEIEIKIKISSYEDIQKVQKKICKECDYKIVVINNFREFDEQ